MTSIQSYFQVFPRERWIIKKSTIYRQTHVSNHVCWKMDPDWRCMFYWTWRIFQHSLCWFTRGSSTSFLDGGNSNIFYFQPYLRGRWTPFWRAYFSSDGLVQPPTSYTSKDGLKPPTSFKWVLENGPFVGLPEDHQFFLGGLTQKKEMLCTCDVRSFTAQLGRIQVQERIFWEGIQPPQMPRYTKGFWPMKNPSYCTY